MSYLDAMGERARMVREWRRHANGLVRAVKKVLPGAEVYAFGSAARGEAVGASDVDILIIASDLPGTNVERARIKVLIEEEAELPYYHPFEIHLVTRGEAEPYLRRAGRGIIKLA